MLRSDVSRDLFRCGLVLPANFDMSREDVEKVADIVMRCFD